MPLRLYMGTIALLFISVLTLLPLPIQANLLFQEIETLLNIVNQSNETICAVFIVPITASSWDEDKLGEEVIAPDVSRAFELASGNYDLLLTDCDGNTLLNKRNIQVSAVTQQVITDADVKSTMCRTRNQEGIHLYQQGRLSEALQVFQTVATCAYEVGDRSGQGRTLSNIGEVYRAQGRYNIALEHYEASLAILHEAGDRAGEGTTLNNIAVLYSAQGSYGAALERYVALLAIRQEMGDRTGEGKTLNNIAGVYRAQGRYGAALEGYEEALTISREVGDRSGESTTLNNIAAVYLAQGRYNDALLYGEASLAIRQIAGDRMGEGKTLNNIAAVYLAQGRYDDALERSNASLAISRELGDRTGESTTLNNIATVYLAQGHYDDALEHLKQVLAIYQEQRDQTGKGKILNNIAAVYDAQGRYSDALGWYEQSLTVRREVGDRSGEGTTLNNIGLAYEAQGRYSKALEHLKQALAIVREVGDRSGEGITLNNIGLVYLAQGHYADALEHHEASLAIVREVGDRNGEGTALASIATVYEAQGDFGNATERHEQALAIMREVGNQTGEGRTLNNIAGVYLTQGRYSKALEQYAQALTILRAIGDRIGEGATLTGIAAIYSAQGRYVDALEYHEASLAIRREVGDRAGEGTTLNNIGFVYDNLGRYGDALERYEQALAIHREVGDRSGEGRTLNNIAGVYLAQGRYSEALEQYAQALAIQIEVGDRRDKGTTLNNIAAVHEAQGRYGEALGYYSDGIDVLESVRSTAGSDQARISFFEDYALVYDRVIALSHQQKDAVQAFWYSERGRARVLLDAIATGQVQLPNHEATNLLTTEQEAYAARQFAQDALAKARAALPPDPIWVSEAEAALQTTEAAYIEAADAIAAYSEQLVGLIPGRQQVLQLEEIQALLDADTTLLSYWTLEDETLAFIITAQHAVIVALPDVTTQSVFSTTERLYQWSNLDNAHPLPLRQLYRALIAPLAGQLKTARLTIIPHQSLHYVPFAALVDEANGKQYLGEQYTLSVLPSANLLPFLRQNATAAQANANGAAVIFGDPATNDPDLERLHYAAAEAGAVANLLQTEFLTDTAASETTFHQAANGARIVHLAAHGTYNQANALYSAIYLAPSSPLTPTQSVTATDGLPAVDTHVDGLLETHEIFGLPLEGNDIVVLSACQTNLGTLSRGDELVGLTRAFFFAGTPTVISSLWNVDDAATETLMVSFYRHWLKEGMSKAAALQAAQSEVRSNPQWVSPFYWAGFVLNGDPGKAHTGS